MTRVWCQISWVLMACLVGCGSSSERARLEAELAEVKAKMAEKDEQLIAGVGTLQLAKTEIERLQTHLKRVEPHFNLTRKEVQAYFETPARGGHRFEVAKVPTEGTRHISSNMKEGTILEINENLDGFVTQVEFAWTLAKQKSESYEDVAARLNERLNDVIEQIDPGVPADEFRGFASGIMKLSKELGDNMRMVRMWPKSEVRGWAVVDVGMFGVVITPKR